MTADADNREIVKLRLAKGEISIEEYEAILRILDGQRVSASEHTPHDKTQKQGATESATAISQDVFEFTGIKKFLLYILVIFSAMCILSFFILMYWRNFSSDQTLNKISQEIIESLFSIDGIIFNLFNWSPPNILRGIIFIESYYVLHFYIKMRLYNKNKTTANYNSLIDIAGYIIFIEIICIICNITTNMFNNILLLFPAVLIFFVFWKTATQQKKDKNLPQSG